MTLAMTAVLPPPARIAPPTSAVAGSAPADRSIELSQARAVAGAIIDAVTAVVAGQRTAVELATACLLSRGHLLIEDVPGVGKTLLAQAITGAVGGSFRRIQGSVDLLPGDVTGTLVPDTHHDHLRLTFRPGPIFANVVVFDELNRTNPRTQSALLEAAEERTVTIDGHSHLLPDPFFLVATQNPIEVAGTFRLGEGTVDRFAAVVSPGRASFDDEVAVIAGRRGRRQLHDIHPVTTLDALVAVRNTVDGVTIPEAVSRYVVELLELTRAHSRVRLGASTRGGLALIGLARAVAVMRGRDYVVPDDVIGAAIPGLAHRLVLQDGDGSTTAGASVVAECLRQLRPPSV